MPRMKTPVAKPNGGFKLTPEEHRARAARFRQVDAAMDVHNMLERLRLAQQHEMLARVIERRLKSSK